jgi:hypothetical protein
MLYNLQQRELRGVRISVWIRCDQLAASIRKQTRASLTSPWERWSCARKTITDDLNYPRPAKVTFLTVLQVIEERRQSGPWYRFSPLSSPYLWQRSNYQYDEHSEDSMRDHHLNPCHRPDHLPQPHVRKYIVNEPVCITIQTSNDIPCSDISTSAVIKFI